MSQSTARTGPSGLVRPEPAPTPRSEPVDGDLEAALWKIRELATRPAPGPVSESVRFSIETAKELADTAPNLYPMSAEAAARVRLIATFLAAALDEIGYQA